MAAPKDSDAKGADEDGAPNTGAAGEALGAREKLAGAAWPEELAAPEPTERKLIWGALLTSCETTFQWLALVFRLDNMRFSIHHCLADLH